MEGNKKCFIKTYPDLYFRSNQRSPNLNECNDFCIPRPDEDHSFDGKYESRYVLIKHFIFPPLWFPLLFLFYILMCVDL